MFNCPQHGKVEAHVSGYPPFEHLHCPMDGCDYWMYFRRTLIIAPMHAEEVYKTKSLHTKCDTIKFVNVTKTFVGV